MKVLIADKIDDKVLKLHLSKSVKFDYRPEVTPEHLLKIIKNYEGLIVRSRTKVTEKIINRGKKLKAIGRAGSGLDNIDLITAKKNNIVVVNTPGANSNAVVELTLGLIFSLLRKLENAYSSMKGGLWLKKDLKGQELNGKTVGIIGYGNIGKKLKTVLESLGVKTYFFSRHKKNVGLKELFAKSDIVTIHLSLTAETENIINNKMLFLMKPSSYLINISRGGVIEEESLYHALKNNKIAGAALDVYWSEPLPPDSKWRKLNNVIMTPHIGASTSEALTRATSEIMEKVIKNLK